MYHESFVPFKDTMLFHITRITQKEVLLVFFHGIGDSHLNYQCFFEMPVLDKYDLFIADFLGHGRSGRSSAYSFATQVKAIEHQLAPFLSQYEKIIFVPHSMGGIHATLLAQDVFADKVSGIFAIETSVTQYGSFVAQKVFANKAKGLSFTEWFNQFCNEIYVDKGIQNTIFRRYHAGLQFVRQEAFLQNALEMHELYMFIKEKAFASKIGNLFVSLAIPTVYCAGRGTAVETLSFLHQHGIRVEHFDTDCHWVAQSCLEDFCNRLDRFISKDAIPLKPSPEK